MKKSVAWAFLERTAVAGAARLHATSEEEADLLATFVDRDRVVLVPNGVEAVAPEAPGRIDALDLPAGAFVVSFIGRLHRIKRLDLLVDAFSRLRAARRDARLVIAGPDEEQCLAPLGHALAALGDAVQYVGPLDDNDKWRLLRRSSALVLCSDSENFGLSAAEAMAAAVPVVVTRTCPWPDVEREGCGFWVEQTPQAIAAALAELAGRPEHARAMGECGARLMRDKYSWNAVGRTFAACYERVMAEQPRRTRMLAGAAC
jgi:glycosyltransferase involved in cell wall biosynthesis